MIHLYKKLVVNNSQAINIVFPIAMWLFSRLAIAIALLLIAPLLPTPPDSTPATFSWQAFSAWDSLWYQKIATRGYDYALDSKQHSIAFFPLFPLSIHLLMSFGLPFEVAGIIVTNLAFLFALIFLYFWVAECHGRSTAMWATAALAWCPYSLFGTVIYTEGLFLLCSTAALRAFDKKQYLWAAFWGALATGTRVNGAMLIPSFLFVSWKERRGLKAYIASLAAGSGLFLFSLYCQIKFSDALAFLHAQTAWRPTFGFAKDDWWDMVMQILVGETYDDGSIENLWHPILVVMITLSGFLLWWFRLQIGFTMMRYGFCLLWMLLWFLTFQPLSYDPFSSDPLVKLTLIFGGVVLLWFWRNQLPLVALVYGFCSFGLIFNTGLPASAERFTYAIVSLSFAFGLLLARYPRWGYPVIVFFAFPLLNLSVRFAHKLWVA